MTDEIVECFNCGRSNPEWAQVCRSCGVPLRHGQARTAPTGRIPTDRDSLISIGAVVATILGAVLLGLFVSSLNPTDPAVGSSDPTPSPTVTPSPTIEPELSSGPSETPAPTAAPTPALPGTLVFGTELDAENQVVEPVETFTPGMTFAHSISSTQPFGSATIGEEVVRLNEDGTPGERIVDPAGNQLSVNPESTTAGFVAGDAANFVRDWGPGLYEMRIFVGETLIARGQFRLAEG
jgi:hypothetical protein